MRFPFLENNQLVLIEYVPGSSGQLLTRLWFELDARIGYDNPEIMNQTHKTAHPASGEINLDILLPKRMHDWFLDKCEPGSCYDYMSYLEIFSASLYALRYRDPCYGVENEFYKSRDAAPIGNVVLHSLHGWDHVLPIEEIRDHGCNVRLIRLIPNSPVGRRYQYARAQACYPLDPHSWRSSIRRFNAKPTDDAFDFVSLLVSKDSDSIIDWLVSQIGQHLRQDKLTKVRQILEIYYSRVVDNLEI